MRHQAIRWRPIGHGGPELLCKHAKYQVDLRTASELASLGAVAA